MKRKLYVENLEMIEHGYVGDTPLEIERYANENGYIFDEDDMGDCYLSYPSDKDSWSYFETDIEID